MIMPERLETNLFRLHAGGSLLMEAPTPAVKQSLDIPSLAGVKLPEWFEDLREREIASDMVNHLNNTELQAKYGLTSTEAKVLRRRLTHRIEEEILTPRGFKKLNRFANAHTTIDDLSFAIRRGNLKGIKLTAWYTNKRNIMTFEK